MSKQDPLVRFLVWRLKHIDTKNFVLILSGLIGACAGLAAVILKSSVHYIQHQLATLPGFLSSNYLYIWYPLIGLLLTVIISNYIIKDKLGHGITSILYDISKRSGVIDNVKIYSRMITSAITVGFGGSVGLEAPIVVTGSAIGSNLSLLAHLDYKRRTLLIGCGAAAAISAIFNSPVAGVIFSIEVILTDVTIHHFIPLLIASVSGSLVSISLSGAEILFAFRLEDDFRTSEVPFYILLGVGCGLVSLYFTRLMYFVEGRLNRIKGTLLKGLAGGVGMAIIILVFPPIYGEGYETIKMLLGQQEVTVLKNSFFSFLDGDLVTLMVFMVGIILIKPVATALTIGGGGSGGIFAPSLFMGGITGFTLGSLLNYFTADALVNVGHFALVGMCGVMSGTLLAPLTAIFLIAEITSGYTLFVPLMLVSAISYSTMSYFEKYSLYTKSLIERGDFIPHDKDLQVLSRISIVKLIEKDLLTIHPDATLGDLVDLVRKSKRNIFPVVDEFGKLTGIITLDDVRELMFDENARANVKISTLMHAPPSTVSPQEKMQSVMNKFEITGVWNLPVIHEGKYLGFVSKSRIFNTYRQELIAQRTE